MAGSPRIITRPTTRSPAAYRRARGRQGQAFGGAEEAPSLTAVARDGDGNMRSGRKNARGAGRTKEWNDRGRQKWRDTRVIPLTKKAPYKPGCGRSARRFGGRGRRDNRISLPLSYFEFPAALQFIPDRYRQSWRPVLGFVLMLCHCCRYMCDRGFGA
jgi:hypothetical protein